MGTVQSHEFTDPEILDQPEESESSLPQKVITISDFEDKDGRYHSDDLLSEMDGQELRDSLDFQMQEEITFLEQMKESGRLIEPEETAFLDLMKKHMATEWRVAESSRTLRYNGQSKRKKQDNVKKARDWDAANEKVRNL